MRVWIEDVGTGSIDKAIKLLAGIPGGAQKAMHSALKRAGDRAKTEAGRFAAEEYTISKGTFMKNVKVTTGVSGSGSGVSMSIKFAGHVLPLLEFNTRYERGGLLTTQVKSNGGAATLQHAFAERVYGPLGVYERVGAPRFPVEEKFGPSTGHMMRNEQVVQKMEKTIREEFDKRMEHEIIRVMNGWGG